MRLLILLVGIPVLELFILLRVKDATSWGFTIALAFITGIIGASLARRQGWATIHRIQREVAAGEVPAKSLVDALMILIAGLLLMTPGILTDVFGFSLLVPVIRDQYRKIAMSWIRKNVRVETFVTSSENRTPDRGVVIDSHVVKSDDDPKPSN